MAHRHALPARRLWSAFSLLLPLLLSPVSASADVTVERLVRTSGIGGFGGGETTMTVTFSALRKREVSLTRVAGALGGFMNQYGGGDATSDTVTDAGAGIVRRLDHRRKTYSEAPLAAPAAGKPGGGAPSGRVVRSDMDVRQTGEAKSINGFPCTRTAITWSVETEEAESRERTTGVMTMDLWSTPATRETAALREQELVFSTALQKKLGLDQAEGEMQRFGLGAMAGLLGGPERVKGAMKEFSSRIQSIKGFPIAYAVTWKSTGSAPGSKPATLFDSYTEIRRIDTDDIPAGAWEVPAGYTRVK
jgi:hypothetical protein